MNRQQRRAHAKMLKKAEKSGVIPEGAGLRTASHTYKAPKPNQPEPEIPGVTVPPQDETFNTMVEHNRWHDRSELDGVVETVKMLSHEEPYEADGNTLKPGCTGWSWARNWDCKYVNIRIDMRDGGFILTNDKGERINLEQLKWQYRSGK